MSKLSGYFTKLEICLWLMSVTAICISYFAFDGSDILILTASIIGATFLILNAKGNPIGQLLTVVFSVLYGVVSWEFSYYGEMITYLGMTLPMAVLALISWLRNPYNNKRTEVKVNRISARDVVLMLVLSLVVTCLFYHILKYFNTVNLLPSTLSVTTSFMAVYLTFRRSPYFALAYAANDIVLIILWSLASVEDTSYISVVVCFTVFCVNDLYGFFNWKKMEKKQKMG